MKNFLSIPFQNHNLSCLPVKEISVYVHIPFCEYRCYYCDFYLETGWSLSILKSFLKRSLDQFSQDYKELGEPLIDTLYIGGGTPSILPPSLLEYFFENFFAITKTFSLPEITFEMNPESCTFDKLKVLSSYSVNRLSLGVQTFQESHLQSMGRRCSLNQIYEALDLIAANWRGDYNLDLITGYPSQTQKELQKDIKEVLIYKPSHISLYDLTVESETVLETLIETKRLTPLLSEIKESFWLKARDLLKYNGYNDYETSNFSLEGKESRHNSHYWSLDPYLGIGAGAVSLWLLKTQQGIKAMRRTNGNVFSYRRKEDEKREIISCEEFLFEHFLVGWRTKRGVSKDKIQRRFGLSVKEKLENILRASFSEEVINDQDFWRLKDYYRDILNTFLSKFQSVLSSQNWRDLCLLGY